ncbi:MAG: acyl-CoA thioesterase [Sedimentitalea sp.]
MARQQTLDITVTASDCDALGHMNVARYISLSNENGFAMQTTMGWPPGETRDGVRLSFAVVQMESSFLAEVLLGETLSVRTDVARIGTKSAVFRNEIWRGGDQLVFRSLWQSVCLDLDTRKGAVIPPSLRAVLEDFLTPEPAP